MSLIPIQTYHSAFDAHMLKSRLESAGIEAFIFDEHMATINPHLSSAMGGVKVMIYEEDHVRAIQFLQKNETERLVGLVISCPHCNSNEVELQTAKKSAFKKFVQGLWALALQIVGGIPKKTYRCQHCGYCFKRNSSL